jgi:hypothetical protein
MTRISCLIRITILIAVAHTLSISGQAYFKNGTSYYQQNHQFENVHFQYVITYTKDTIQLDSISSGKKFYSYYNGDSNTVSLLYVKDSQIFFKVYDTGYTLVYNFKLSAGDSFKFYTVLSKYKKPVWQWIKIDSVKKFTVWNKKIRVQYFRPPVFELFTFAEGIGSLQQGLQYWRYRDNGQRRIHLGLCEGDSGLTWDRNWYYMYTPVKFRTGIECSHVQNLLHTSNLGVLLNQPFPNPTSGNILFTANGPITYSVFDVSGHCLLTECIKSAGTIKIGLEKFTPGIYCLLVKSIGNTESFLIQKE